MRWIGWLLRSKDRRLELSTGGKWFIAFTIVLGVVAINSGNNVIYLLESLLLSSLIFSGVMSELTLRRLQVSRVVRQAVAGEPAGDLLVLKNKGLFPLYCVEIGEWANGRFEVLHFVLQVPGRSELRLRSEQALSRRGRHSWEGLALGTSFPFGFARKIRLLPESGGRIVWPSRQSRLLPPWAAGESEWEASSGELEEVQPWEDLSRVHWPSSSRSGRFLARPRKRASQEGVVILNLEGAGEEREGRISGASFLLQRRAKALVLREGGNLRRIEGAWRALDALALLPEER